MRAKSPSLRVGCADMRKCVFSRAVCSTKWHAGTAGASGPSGAKGQDGRDGLPGGRPQIVTVPMRDVWGQRIPPSLAELINYRPPGRARR